MESAYCRKDLHSLLGAHPRETGAYRDTSLYALNLRKNIFVEKLGNRYLITCVKIKLLGILYIIKDANGNHMSGLVVMLIITCRGWLSCL